jgi:hypothetical protein
MIASLIGCRIFGCWYSAGWVIIVRLAHHADGRSNGVPADQLPGETD